MSAPSVLLAGTVDARTTAFLADAARLTPAGAVQVVNEPDSVVAVLTVAYDQRRDIIALAAQHGLTIDSVNAASCYVYPEGVEPGSSVEVVSHREPPTRDEVALAYARALIRVNDDVTVTVTGAPAGANVVAAANGELINGTRSTPIAEVTALMTAVTTLYAQVTALLELRVRNVLYGGAFGSDPEPATPLEDILATLLKDNGLDDTIPSGSQSGVHARHVLETYGHLIATAIGLTQ